MAERDPHEQLERALSGDAASAGAQARELAAIARRLRQMPREDFRIRLKNILEEKAMATAKLNPIPAGLYTITPYLIVNGAAQFIDFMKQAFGAEEIARFAAPDGRLMHAEVRIRDSKIEVGDSNEQYPPRPGALHIYVPDADRVYESALAAGATSLHALTDQPYGDREGSVRDPLGNNWYIATHQGGSHVPEGLRTVTPYLHASGSDKLIEFLKEAFTAEELGVYRSEDGTVLHAKIRIGESVIEMGESHGQWQPMPMGFHFHVPNTDAIYARALEAGAKALYPPEDKPYGERSAGVLDPAGNSWFIATALK
jgi:PhnB protein